MLEEHNIQKALGTLSTYVVTFTTPKNTSIYQYDDNVIQINDSFSFVSIQAFSLEDAKRQVRKIYPRLKRIKLTATFFQLKN